MNNKRKQLKNDITRIHEIMGINKPLLMEQAWVDDLVTSLINVGVKSESKLLNAAYRVANETLSAVERGKAFDDMYGAAYALSKKGDDAALKVIKARLRNSLLPSVIDTTVSDLASSPASVDAFTNAVKNGYTDTQILDDIMGAFNPNTGDEVLDEVAKNAAKRKVQAELKNIRTNLADDAATAAGKQADDAAAAAGKQTDDVATDAGKQADDAATDAGKQADDAATDAADDITNSTDNLTDEQLEAEGVPAFQELDEELTRWGNIPKITDDEAEVLLSVAKKDTNFYNWVKKNSDIINSRIERVEKLSRLLTTTTDEVLKTRVQAQIKKDLYKIGIEGKNYIGQVNNKLKLIIENFPRERGVIIDPNERLFAEYFKDLSTATDGFAAEKLSVLTEKDGTVNWAIRAAKSAWNGSDVASTILRLPRRGLAEFKKAFGMNVEPIDEMILAKAQNTKNWFMTGSARGNPWYAKYHDNYMDIISTSGLSAAKKSYLFELFLKCIKWKAIWSSLYAFRNGISSLVAGTETRAKINACLAKKNDKTATKEQIQQACSEVEAHFGTIWAMDFMEEGGPEESLKKYFADWGDQFTDFFDDVPDEFTDYIPGVWDDAISNIVKFLSTAFKESTMEQVEESLLDAQNNAETQIENAQSQLDTALAENGVTMETIIPAELSDYSEHIKLIDGKMYYDEQPYEVKKVNDIWSVFFPAGDGKDAAWYNIKDI